MTSSFTINAVVISLLLIVMTATVGCVILAFDGKAIPETLANVATTGLGALAALLASTRSTPPADKL